jgi:sugar/nucleoside kinase (ribokinase family)
MIKNGIGVVGSTTIDTIIEEDLSFNKLGGVTTYSGITYARNEIRTLVVSNVAEQDIEILDKLQDENIFVYNGETDHTTCFVNRIKGDKRRQEIPQAARPIEYSQILEVTEKVDALHLGPLHPLDIESRALKSLAELNKFIIVDVQGYTRQVKDRTVFPRVSKQLSDALKIARLVKSNGAELKSILAFYQTGLGKLMQRFKIEEFVITLGAGGGFVKQVNGKEFHYKAPNIESVDDPTGAGDVFFAAYIISRFLKNETIPDACRYAAALSARQVEGKYISRDKLILL